MLSAVGLALDRSRLAAEVRAQLDEVASSRARIVAAAEAERRRIQRNLHDGAQQRLVGAAMLVRRARTRALAHGDTEQAQLLTRACDEVEGSLGEIRHLASGLRPPLLDEQGLLAALDSLAERAAVPTIVCGHLDTRPSSATESAAFFVASECLANTVKHAAATSAVITVDTEGDLLVVDRQRRRTRRSHAHRRQRPARTPRPRSRPSTAPSTCAARPARERPSRPDSHLGDEHPDHRDRAVRPDHRLDHATRPAQRPRRPSRGRQLPRVRQIVVSHGGTNHVDRGDRVSAMFSSVTRALDAAVALQQATHRAAPDSASGSG